MHVFSIQRSKKLFAHELFNLQNGGRGRNLQAVSLFNSIDDENYVVKCTCNISILSFNNVRVKK